jgi:hypothetical protein
MQKLHVQIIETSQNTADAASATTATTALNLHIIYLTLQLLVLLHHPLHLSL